MIQKDTTINAETTGEFAWNLSTLAMFLIYLMFTSLAHNVTSIIAPYSDDVALSKLLLLLILGTINHDDEFFTSWHKHCPIIASLLTWPIWSRLWYLRHRMILLQHKYRLCIRWRVWKLACIQVPSICTVCIVIITWRKKSSIGPRHLRLQYYIVIKSHKNDDAKTTKRCGWQILAVCFWGPATYSLICNFAVRGWK